MSSITLGLLHGPNFKRLETRPPEQYQGLDLAIIESRVSEEVQAWGWSLNCFQSNLEGALIDQLEAWQMDKLSGVILNLGGYSHTSVALRDCIEHLSYPCWEVHISNLWQREPFRQTMLTGSVCAGTFTGMGLEGYLTAAYAQKLYLKKKENPSEHKVRVNCR